MYIEYHWTLYESLYLIIIYYVSMHSQYQLIMLYTHSIIHICVGRGAKTHRSSHNAVTRGLVVVQRDGHLAQVKVTPRSIHSKIQNISSSARSQKSQTSLTKRRKRRKRKLKKPGKLRQRRFRRPEEGCLVWIRRWRECPRIEDASNPMASKSFQNPPVYFRFGSEETMNTEYSVWNC